MGRASRKIAESAASHLRPGEAVQACFAVQPRVRFTAGDRYWTVVATAQRILVFDSGTFKQTKASEVLAELPRSTRFGEPTSLLWHPVELGPHRMLANRRYFNEIRAADAAHPA